MTYAELLQGKVDIAAATGFHVDPGRVSPVLKPFQRLAVAWAVAGGRRALFESFGLGKTMQQLEFCRLVTEEQGGRALIVLPLGVRPEFVRDAEKLGLPRPAYVRSMAEARAAKGSILLTNYERVRDGDIDPGGFTATSLDEAAVLRSFGSKTYQTFLDKFKGVPYKLVCTATPDPNRTKELIHYAGYLEIMDTGHALTKFFQRDSSKANHLTLYPHREEEFWLWVASWALFIGLPSDLGDNDSGYVLPPLRLREHIIPNDYSELPADRDGQVKLMRDAAVSLSDAAREKQRSIRARVRKAAEIVACEPESHFILWHDLEEERREIKRQLPAAVDIHGSMGYEEREQRVIDFSDGKIRLFATKKSLSGAGCNFQRYCSRAVFVGIDYNFNDFIQAIHRIYRFLQPGEVMIDVIYTEAEAEIWQSLLAKWQQHDEQQQRMRAIVRKYGLCGADIEQLRRKMGVERVEVKGEHYTAVLNDCVLELPGIAGNSVGLIHTSIPFGNHYEYSGSYHDFGHNLDTNEFFTQMDYLSPQLLRVLQPGRVFACHVKDRVLFGGVTGDGMPTIEPFHALCIEHYTRHGFRFCGMITVVTDVVRENNQTYRLGWSEVCKDGSKMGVGCPEYILLFRKLPTNRSKAYADIPVVKSKAEYTRAQWQLDAHAFWRSSGDRLLDKEEVNGLLAAMNVSELQKLYRTYSRNTVYDYQAHIALTKKLDAEGKLPATFMVCAPGSWDMRVWDDINRMRTLNTEQSRRRMAMHVCPLQLDIVERIINRYSNPGDLILDPFAGLMTVPMQAVKMGRYGYGVELSPEYFRDGLGYLQAAEDELNTPTLFDFVATQSNSR